MSTISLCQLSSYDFTRLSIRWISAAAGESVETETIASAFDYDVWKNPEDDLSFLMRFSAQFNESTANGNNLGYQIETEIFGRLRLAEQILEEERSMYVRINGVSIMLGLVRAQICVNTGCFAGGKFVIPTFMPHAIVEGVEARKKPTKEVSGKPRTGRSSRKSDELHSSRSKPKGKTKKPSRT